VGSIVIHDGVSAGGTTIAAIDLVKVLGSIRFDIPFSDGLTVVSTGSVVITMTYE